MLKPIQKKALIFQSLFFCVWGSAQTAYIAKPRSDEALQNPQEFEVGYSGQTPQKVEFFLNGKLLMARTQPPFRFETRWNTRLKNDVKFVVYFNEGKVVKVEKTFEEIRSDVEASVEAVLCFPFFNRDIKEWTISSNGQQLTPQKFEPADDAYRLSLILALDVSGSMKYTLPAIEPAFRSFLNFCKDRPIDLKLLTFDHRPRLIQMKDIPEQLEDLYNGKGESVIWDALATATELFDAGTPRRIVLLVSDGVEEGSKHDQSSVANYLERSGGVLIWLSPNNALNRPLFRLSKWSGGFTLYTENQPPWPRLHNRLAHQYHLLARGATFPIKIKVRPGSAWYPQWENTP